LLNGLQMIVSLLSLQSRAATNADVASHMATAADRVAAIGRIHRRLHSLDGVEVFALKPYIEDLCRDLSLMLSAERPERAIVVDGVEIQQSAGTAIPLGFIASELIANAVKHGTGRITVRLEANPPKGYALTVSSGRQRTGNEDHSVACRSHGRRVASQSRRQQPRRAVYGVVLLIARLERRSGRQEKC
jgi:two-component sensor histidine kinase